MQIFTVLSKALAFSAKEVSALSFHYDAKIKRLTSASFRGTTFIANCDEIEAIHKLNTGFYSLDSLTKLIKASGKQQVSFNGNKLEPIGYEIAQGEAFDLPEFIKLDHDTMFVRDSTVIKELGDGSATHNRLSFFNSTTIDPTGTQSVHSYCAFRSGSNHEITRSFTFNGYKEPSALKAAFTASDDTLFYFDPVNRTITTDTFQIQLLLGDRPAYEKLWNALPLVSGFNTVDTKKTIETLKMFKELGKTQISLVEVLGAREEVTLSVSLDLLLPILKLTKNPSFSWTLANDNTCLLVNTGCGQYLIKGIV
jgi:hypothetical protein